MSLDDFKFDPSLWDMEKVEKLKNGMDYQDLSNTLYFLTKAIRSDLELGAKFGVSNLMMEAERNLYQAMMIISERYEDGIDI